MELGKLTAVFDADTKKFDAGLRHVETKIGGVTKDINKVTTGSTQASAGLASMGTALGVAAGSAVVATAALSSAVTGIYKLTTFSQELGSAIFDLSQKINFSAETLSSLKVAAELSGGSLASLSTSLGIFDRNMEEAKESGSEMSKVFKALKIDTDDNEKALRQAFKALAGLTGGAQQTALAMKLFGRSGKEVLGIVKETGGNVDSFIRKMEELGLTISTSGAKKADEFGDQLTLLQLKLEAIARQIGTELVPTVSKAADDISKWLKENQGEIERTAKELATLVGWVYELARIAAIPIQLQIIVNRRFINTGATVADLPFGSGMGTAVGTALGGLLGNERAQGTGPQFRDEGEFVLPGSPVADTGGGLPKPRGGRGGGGGKSRMDEALRDQKRLDDLILNHFKDRLESEEGELARSYDKRSILFQEYFDESNRLEEERYKKVKANLEKEEAVARERVEGGKGGLKAEIALQEAVNALFEEKVRHSERLAEIAREQRVEQERIADSLERQKDRLNDMLLSALGISQSLSEFGSVATATGALGQLGEPPDISAQSQAILDMRERIRDEMINLGHDLTSVFSRAIGDGFERGAKRGLQSLALGLLDIVQNIFLRKLAEGLGNILSDIALGSGSGGSWWSKLIGIGLGAVGGSVGGSIGGGGGAGGGLSAAKIAARASGGSVLPNMPYRVHKDEIIVPTQNGMVLNKGQQGSVNNYYIQLPQTPKGGYSSPSSQRELANKLVAALQGANT